MNMRARDTRAVSLKAGMKFKEYGPADGHNRANIGDLGMSPSAASPKKYSLFRWRSSNRSGRLAHFRRVRLADAPPSGP